MEWYVGCAVGFVVRDGQRNWERGRGAQCGPEPPGYSRKLMS